MPVRQFDLTDHHDRFVHDALATGRYRDASEVVRAGLRLLEQRENEDEVKLARLRAAIAEGEAALAQGDYEDVGLEDLNGWMKSLHDDTSR